MGLHTNLLEHLRETEATLERMRARVASSTAARRRMGDLLLWAGVATMLVATAIESWGRGNTFPEEHGAEGTEEQNTCTS